jgi:hypothetical protein
MRRSFLIQRLRGNLYSTADAFRLDNAERLFPTLWGVAAGYHGRRQTVTVCPLLLKTW